MPVFRNKWTPLFLSNFLGVYNDNLLKNCIIFISIGWALPGWLTQSQLISLVSASLVVPYLFLSPLAGRLAVIYSKKSVFRFFKLLEIPVLAIACVAFHFKWVMVAVSAVFAMGILSCLYSPSKYSLIRDIGGEPGVSFGSGVFEMMAFLGILIGTVTASVVSDHYQPVVVYVLFMGLAALGYFSTRSIEANELPEDEPTSSLNPFSFLKNSYLYARQHSGVNAAVLGASAFWLVGGMLQMNLVIHCRQVYHVSNSTTGFVMACAAIGIALGSFVAGKISGNEVKKGFVLFGSGSMSLLFAIITFVPMGFVLFVACVSGIAFMGGFFQIPCLSMVQKADVGRKLGDMIGYLNLVTFIFVLAGTGFFSLTTFLTHENSYAVFGVITAVCLFVSGYFFKRSPGFRNETAAMLGKIFR